MAKNLCPICATNCSTHTLCKTCLLKLKIKKYKEAEEEFIKQCNKSSYEETSRLFQDSMYEIQTTNELYKDNNLSEEEYIDLLHTLFVEDYYDIEMFKQLEYYRKLKKQQQKQEN